MACSCPHSSGSGGAFSLSAAAGKPLRLLISIKEVTIGCAAACCTTCTVLLRIKDPQHWRHSDCEVQLCLVLALDEGSPGGLAVTDRKECLGIVAAYALQQACTSTATISTWKLPDGNSSRRRRSTRGPVPSSKQAWTAVGMGVTRACGAPFQHSREDKPEGHVTGTAGPCSRNATVP